MRRIQYIIKLILPLILIFSAADAFARKSSLENWLQDKWCRDHGGTTNARLNDRSICECLTWKNGITIEFNPEKWMETLGVALNYSMRTGLRGGVVLVIREKKEKSFWIRLQTTIKYYQLPIDTWLWERY